MRFITLSVISFLAKAHKNVVENSSAARANTHKTHTHTLLTCGWRQQCLYSSLLFIFFVLTYWRELFNFMYIIDTCVI